eukprot:5005264-Pleurochrysis_carterae.AAC.4
MVHVNLGVKTCTALPTCSVSACCECCTGMEICGTCSELSLKLEALSASISSAGRQLHGRALRTQAHRKRSTRSKSGGGGLSAKEAQGPESINGHIHYSHAYDLSQMQQLLGMVALREKRALNPEPSRGSSQLPSLGKLTKRPNKTQSDVPEAFASVVPANKANFSVDSCSSTAPQTSSYTRMASVTCCHWQTGCSSCWDGLGTFENRLTSATRCQRHFCDSLRVPNDSPTYTKAINGCFGRQIRAQPAEWLYKAKHIIYLSRGPSLARKQSVLRRTEDNYKSFGPCHVLSQGFAIYALLLCMQNCFKAH